MPDGDDQRGRQQELDFDGLYRLERHTGGWRLIGPAFAGGAMHVPGGSAAHMEVVGRFRDVAELMNRAVEAERRRVGGAGKDDDIT